MSDSKSRIAAPSPILWTAVALALAITVAYVLIASHILPAGGLRLADDGSVIMLVAAGGYLLGGLLILLRNKWLWVLGVVINALVMLFFFRLYAARPSVIFSPAGLVTKSLQLLVEAALLYLIVTNWNRSQNDPRRRAGADRQSWSRGR